MGSDSIKACCIQKPCYATCLPRSGRTRRRTSTAASWARSWAFGGAWTAGIFGPYALVVWVGSFDGSGNPAFVGVDAAAPLFFRIVDAVRDENPRLAEPALRPPPGVKRVEICLGSGDLP